MTSGIDNKANMYVNIHEAMTSSYKMKQGARETNNHLLGGRSKVIIAALKLTDEEHLIFSPKLYGHIQTHNQILWLNDPSQQKEIQ